MDLNKMADLVEQTWTDGTEPVQFAYRLDIDKAYVKKLAEMLQAHVVGAGEFVDGAWQSRILVPPSGPEIEGRLYDGMPASWKAFNERQRAESALDQV